MEKREVIHMCVRILLQLLLLPLICFFIFGFCASFEYPFPSRYHLIYLSLLAVSSWAFLRLSTRQRWHKLTACFLLGFIYLLFLSIPLAALLSKIDRYLHGEYLQLMQMIHNLEFHIGKWIAGVIDKK